MKLILVIIFSLVTLYSFTQDSTTTIGDVVTVELTIASDTTIVTYMYIAENNYVKFGTGVRIRVRYQELGRLITVAYTLFNDRGELTAIDNKQIINVLTEAPLPKQEK